MSSPGKLLAAHEIGHLMIDIFLIYPYLCDAGREKKRKRKKLYLNAQQLAVPMI